MFAKVFFCRLCSLKKNREVWLKLCFRFQRQNDKLRKLTNDEPQTMDHRRPKLNDLNISNDLSELSSV